MNSRDRSGIPNCLSMIFAGFLSMFFFGTLGGSSLYAQVILTSNYCPQDPGGVTTYSTVGTFYQNLVDYPGTGNCGYAVGDYDPNLYCAIDGYSTDDYQAGLACGACVAVHDSGNGKSVTLMIVDQCGNCSNPNQIDMSPSAFALMEPGMPGQINITWNFTQCPANLLNVGGANPSYNITYNFKDTCNTWYSPIQFMDSLFPITAVQVSSGGGAYVPLSLATTFAGNDSYWENTANNGNMGPGPYNFILTDVRNDSITLGPVVECNPLGASVAGQTGLFATSNAQFPPCGPTWTPGPATNTYTPTFTYTPSPTPTIGSPTATPTVGSPTMTFTSTPTHISSGCTVTSATLKFLDDDNATFYMNGTLLGSCISTAGAVPAGTVTCWANVTTININPALLTSVLALGQNVLGVDLADTYYSDSGVCWDLVINYSCCPSQEITSSDGDILYHYAGYTNAITYPPEWDYPGFTLDSSWTGNYARANTMPPVPVGYSGLLNANGALIDWLGPTAGANYQGQYQDYLFRETFDVGGNAPCATATPLPTLTIQKSILGATTGIIGGPVTYIVKTTNSGGPYTGPVTVSEGNPGPALYYSSSGGYFNEWNFYYKNWNTGLPGWENPWLNPPLGPNFYWVTIGGNFEAFYWVYPEGFPGNGFSDSVTYTVGSSWYPVPGGPCNVLNDAVLSYAGAAPLTSNTVEFQTTMICTVTPSTPTPTPTNTNTVTPTNTVTNTATPTNTATNTSTNTPTRTPTNTNTVTPTNTVTNTSTPTNTVTPTNTDTNTATYTMTMSPTNTNTVTPTNTVTNTETPTNTATVTNTRTNTSTPTPTSTQTDTPNNTPIITNTPTNTPTNSATNTLTKTPTNTSTWTDTYTATPTPTNSNTPTWTISPTNTATNTATKSPTNTNTITNTYTVTNTRTDTNTATPTTTVTDTFTFTNTPTNTATNTATNSPTNTPITSGIANVSKVASNTAPGSNDGEAYVVGISVPDSGVSNVTISDTIPAGLTYISATNPTAPSGTLSVLPIPTPAPTSGFGTLLVWNFPFVPTGNWGVTVNTTINDFMPGGTVIDNQAALSYPTTSVVKFADAPVTVTGNFTVRINVYNEAGEIVKTILITHYSEPVLDVSLLSSDTLLSIKDKINIVFHGIVLGTWDGTNDSGSEVSNGKYYIKIDNVDPMGTVTTETKVAMVARHLAIETVNIYNEAGEVIRHLYQSIADSQSLSSGVTLSTNTVSPSYSGGPNATVNITLSDGSVLTWDGKNDNGSIVTNGQYFIEIETNNGSGGSATVTKQVTVFHNGLNPAGNDVVAYPNPLSLANKGKQVNFSIGTPDMTLKVNVYTVAGEYIAHRDGLPGSSFVAWDFPKESVASGLYIAVIEIQNPTGGEVRQMRKIAIIQ